MKNILLTFLAILLFTPNYASAASPVLTYIFNQLNQLNTAVTQLDERVTANANDISTNASDITENRDAISAIASQAVLKDANGIHVGRVIGMSRLNHPYVLTEQGYQSVINVFQGMVVNMDIGISIAYESTNCIGPAYRQGHGLATIGTVFIGIDGAEEAYNADLIFYTPLDAQTQTINVNSQLIFDGVNITCDQLPSPVSSDAIQALPNDPNVTGIQNTAYPAYMRIE